MTGPYRASCAPGHAALLADEHALLVRAGRVMIAVGSIGLLAAAFGACSSLAENGLSFIACIALPAVLGGFTLLAGIALARMPSDARDYAEISRAVKYLCVVYALKGTTALVLALPLASIAVAVVLLLGPLLGVALLVVAIVMLRHWFSV